ncbi:MAG: PD-(D/E)XK motif protein [Acidipila sp.]|nr:PD-(D/E)XK motif protein [Acidipila sp.]
MTPSEMEKAWSDLPNAEFGQLSGIRAPGLPPQAPVYVAVDPERRRQLLVVLPAGTEPLKMTITRGLEVKTEELRVGESSARTYIQLVCLHPAHYSTFSALGANIVAAVSADPLNPKAAVARCLDRWRSFWAVDQSGLTREQALGLFGELWFLLRWMGPLSAAIIARWQGPLGARHDFQWSAGSVEVKATSSGSGKAPVHLIANLEQLDSPETGQLYMFSLHVTDDALAANSMPVLAEQINTLLSHDVEAKSLFSERLAKAGYNPVDASRYIRPLRVLAEELYRVDESFPKLTQRSFVPGLPPGVGDVAYSLSMAACARWRIATAPTDPGASSMHR